MLRVLNQSMPDEFSLDEACQWGLRSLFAVQHGEDIAKMIIHQALKLLVRLRILRFAAGTFKRTQIGRIAKKFYISPQAAAELWNAFGSWQQLDRD